MSITANQDTLPGACGVSCLYDFRDSATYGYLMPIKKMVPEGGTGIVCAGFIYKDTNCEQAFKEMSKRGKLLFKTRVRKNRNSGNKFYFAVFDFADKGKAKYGFDDYDRSQY